MKQINRLLYLFLTLSVFWINSLKPLSIQSSINLLTDVAGVWKELSEAMQEVLDYAQINSKQLPQFFCGSCHSNTLCFNDFFEKMLASQMGCTVGIILCNNNIYDIEFKFEEAADLEQQFAQMKQVFQTKNVDAINAYLQQILDKKEIISFWCSECYNYSWQCKNDVELSE